MNRTRRKAARMWRRKYGKATNLYWKAQPHPSVALVDGLIERAFQGAYEKCAAPPCRTCGGYGFVAQKQFLDDGYGEVDSCPTCT